VGTKKEEGIGDCKKLHNEEKRDAYRFLVRKPSGTRPLGRPTCRLEDNITRHLKEL
jgi:hypothetical protein